MVQHQCFDDEGGLIHWYKGHILGINSKAGIRADNTKFRIKYDEYEDEFIVPLIQDLKKGDLIILRDQ